MIALYADIALIAVFVKPEKDIAPVVVAKTRKTVIYKGLRTVNAVSCNRITVNRRVLAVDM